MYKKNACSKNQNYFYLDSVRVIQQNNYGKLSLIIYLPILSDNYIKLHKHEHMPTQKIVKTYGARKQKIIGINRVLSVNLRREIKKYQTLIT